MTPYDFAASKQLIALLTTKVVVPFTLVLSTCLSYLGYSTQVLMWLPAAALTIRVRWSTGGWLSCWRHLAMPIQFYHHVPPPCAGVMIGVCASMILSANPSKQPS